MGLIESKRTGTTGIGYTFETLLGKKEDKNFTPDFMGIEINAKLGYSKSPLTLFNLTPYMNNNSSIQYIIDNFSYNIANPSKLKK